MEKFSFFVLLAVSVVAVAVVCLFMLDEIWKWVKGRKKKANSVALLLKGRGNCYYYYYYYY